MQNKTPTWSWLCLGKHGQAKISLVGLDIFTGQKMEDVVSTSANMNCPVVVRQEYQLLNIENNTLVWEMEVLSDAWVHISGKINWWWLEMIQDGNMDGMPLPEGDLGARLLAAFLQDKRLSVCVLAALGEKAIVSYKEI